MKHLNATSLLRLCVMLLTAIGLLLFYVSFLVIADAGTRFLSLTQKTVPVLLDLDEMSESAFEGAGSAVLIMSANSKEQRLAALEETRKSVDLLNEKAVAALEADASLTPDIRNHLAIIQTQVDQLSNDIQLLPDDRHTTVANLREMEAKLKLLSEKLEYSKLSARNIPNGTEAPLLTSTLQRLLNASADLAFIQDGVRDLIDAESLGQIARVNDSVKRRFVDFYATISRMPDTPLRTELGTTIAPFYRAFLDGSATRNKVEDLTREADILAAAGNLVAQYSLLKADTSAVVQAQRASVKTSTTELESSLLSSKLFLIFAAFVFFGLSSLIIFFVIERKIVRRLRGVEQQVYAIQQDDFSDMGRLSGRDEISALSAAVDQLRCLSQQRNEFEEQLKKSKIEAESVAKIKTDFLAMMSHEVRTPLNAIMGMFELIEAADIPARQKKRAHHGRAAAEGLFHLLTNILDAARIDAGRLELNVSDCALRGIADQVALLMEGTVAKSQKPITPKVEVDPGLPETMQCDQDRLIQILVNLVDNAVRFTDEGMIRIRIAPAMLRGAEAVLFEISDSGIGIEAHLHDQIFEKFRQIDGGPSRSVGGSGLGLPISRELIEMMGGEIHLQSAPGHGTTFFVSLPVHESHINPLNIGKAA
ncbi:Autoinducer 2 sensor kinase/phosphatase LuxQ [Aquimixticola soesokkakensis]|uniref:histidine kinase n=1 Tax=Aquimixticola soesokkakensis TaxID=1519096 RepID=A0A1Y5T9G9_9RHOB|nr:ATP-binding protein [Aquimixticola soesokkakensis]SLN55356.1 Autoinducer 2 sensor kinase/phosphatase LuxQ [Aquimixticola soesokkakensis]